MCEISEKWYQEGVTDGRKAGRRQGKIQGKTQQARETSLRLSQLGMSPELISQIVKFNVRTVKKWLAR